MNNPNQHRMTLQEFDALALEASIQGTICEWLDLMQLEHSVTDASRTFNHRGEARRSKVRAGWPDVTVVVPIEIQGVRVGISWLIETKRRTGRLRAAQEELIPKLRAAGAVVTIARSLDDVQRDYARIRMLGR